MIGGPVYEREMLLSFRRGRTYLVWGGFLVGLFVLLFVLWPVRDATSTSLPELSARARTLFRALSLLEVSAVALLVPAFAATAFALEKETNTLGLLLLSETGPFSIVAGKAAFRMTQAAILMTLALPGFAALLNVGGITAGELGMVYALSLGLAALATGVGVIASVVCRKGYRAILLAYVVCAGLAAAVPALDLAWDLGAWRRHLSPVDAVWYVFDPRRYGDLYVTTWWLHPLLDGLIGTGLVALAGLRLPASVTARSRLTKAPPVVRAEAEGPLRVGRAGNPLAFRESCTGLSSRPWARILVPAGLGLLLGAVGWFLRDFFADLVVQSWASALLVTFVVLAVTVVAATSVSREREEATLPLLATTPVGAGTFLRGRAWGIIRNLLPVALLPVAWTIGWAVVGVFPWYVAVFHVPLVAVTLVTCAFGGLYWSFQVESSVRATVLALGSILGGGVIGGCCCLPLCPPAASGLLIYTVHMGGGNEPLLLAGVMTAMLAVVLCVPYALYKHLLVRFDELVGRTA